MFGQTKYVTFSDGMMEFAIIFPSHQVHSDVAQRFDGCKVLGAGFVNLKTNTPTGESTSLGVKPHEMDEFLIQQVLGYPSRK